MITTPGCGIRYQGDFMGMGHLTHVCRRHVADAQGRVCHVCPCGQRARVADEPTTTSTKGAEK